MKFSLIIATLGRSKELERLFKSLVNQTYKDFEIILVDQNSDDRVFNIYSQYKEYLTIKYIHTDKKGLSRARNIGLTCDLKDIVAFPDDDCWYPKDTLEKVKIFFEVEDYSVLSGRPVDKYGKTLVNKYLTGCCDINTKNVWNAAISFTVFLRKNVIAQTGKFDEVLGVGSNSIYGSGEETDYLIRGLQKKIKMRYLPSLRIFHPRKTSVGDSKELERALAYGAGMGYVLKKHNYSWYIIFRSLIRPLGGALLAGILGNGHMCRFRFNTFIGRLKGLNAKL